MARSDRFSQLPEDILDHILGFLPIQDIVRTTVLSTIWRDLWFTLRQLCFDRRFFSYIDKKNRTSKYVKKSCAFYIINKVLLQHRGTIQKFAIDLSQVGKVSIRSRSFDFDQCLDLVVRKGVQEVHLQFWGESYKLPNCIFSCSTVKSLHLCRINIVPIDFPHTLPYLTSLYFEDIRFGPADLPYYVIDVPMLKNLSFSNCGDISPFKVTARNLCNLTIKDCCSSQLCSIFPLASNLISIRTLDLHCESLQGLPQETDATNVELLKLEGFRFHNDGLTSAFVHLLCICPQLCKLEITFSVIFITSFSWTIALCNIFVTCFMYFLTV
ncbi:unnamed protein product [Cuscuta epithymum]|uniref:F-box domain-containing protein n=1 Tax=Cuscuta epithymum TaxID=186058 RepID=A0AAV0DG13_9ASTE|nr:unnamed protein product [Cuscuta epithymum]